MFAQGTLGGIHGSSCLYRDELGNACGVGLLVSPEIGRNWDEVSTGSAIEDLTDQPNFPPELRPHIHLLSEIQGAHDNVVTDGDLDTEGQLRAYLCHMVEVAQTFDLTVDVDRIPDRFKTLLDQ